MPSAVLPRARLERMATWPGEQLPPEAARRGVWPAMALLVVALVAALGAVLLEGLGDRLEGSSLGGWAVL